MSALVTGVRIKFLLIFIFMFSPCTFASALISPKRTVESFYQLLLSGDIKNKSEIISKHASDNLIKSIKDSTMCNYDSDGSVTDSELQKICSAKRECKEYKGNYLCNWYSVWIESDINYFTKSQEDYPSWSNRIKTRIVTQEENDSVIAVVLGEGKETSVPLRVSVKKINDQWKITSVTE